MYYLTRIHVNRHHIAANAKDGGTRPEFTLKVNGKTLTAHQVMMPGPTVGISARHCGRRPLACGAKVWMETRSPVYADGVLINARPPLTNAV